MIPYALKTLQHAREEFDDFMDGTDEQREKYAWHKLERELEQGFQSLELKLNTVPSSRGDFAFTTITFGCVDSGTDEERKIQRLIGSVLLRVRKTGHGGLPVVFP